MAKAGQKVEKGKGKIRIKTKAQGGVETQV